MKKGPSRKARYVRLTRSDLIAFDTDATALILEAMDAGCVGRISSKGHCILRNDGGGTAAIARSLKSLGRSGQNARSAMKRFLAEQRCAAAS